jgi:hypothetical protein
MFYENTLIHRIISNLSKHRIDSMYRIVNIEGFRCIDVYRISLLNILYSLILIFILFHNFRGPLCKAPFFIKCFYSSFIQANSSSLYTSLPSQIPCTVLFFLKFVIDCLHYFFQISSVYWFSNKGRENKYMEVGFHRGMMANEHIMVYSNFGDITSITSTFLFI